LQSFLIAAMATGLLLLDTWTAAAQPPTPSQTTRRVFLPLAEGNLSAGLAHGIPQRLDEPQIHVLREGDDLAELALELGRDVADMACVTASGLEPLSNLRPGQTIVIPSPRYLCHTVQDGETVATIAQRYQVNPAPIVELAWNRLDSTEDTLVAGRRLLIFNGVRPDPQALREAADLPPMPEPTAVPTPEGLKEPWPYGDGQFIWPAQGPISQDYHLGHKAIDIAVDRGTPVLAADNGVVTKAGWSEIGYGWRVIVDHNIDYITLYAHLDNYFVEEGEVVEKGQIIGISGSTGHSTGPHVHFELRDFGYLVDPIDYLR
jgi:murein DD-endopeptidase MepM/ murein hydrolase activator NlpD